MWLDLLLMLALFASIAMLYREGLWSNAITLLGVILSGLAASSLFEPVARGLEAMQPELTYLWDFIALWLVFSLSFVLFRVAADLLSAAQVRVRKALDSIGGGVLALWIGWVMICFSTMTLHTAPLPRDFFGGAYEPDPDHGIFFGLAPDRQWLGLVQSVSRGSLSNSPSEGVEGEDAMNVFDPRAEFIYKYAQRRRNFEHTRYIRVYRFRE